MFTPATSPTAPTPVFGQATNARIRRAAGAEVATT